MQEFYKQVEAINSHIDFLKSELAYIKFINENDLQGLSEHEYVKDYDKLILEKEKTIKMYEEKLSNLINNTDRKSSLEDYIDTITLGDCMEHLPRIPKNSIHLFISDIPYGINLDEWDVLHNNTNSALLGASPAQEGKSAFKRRGKPINGWNKDDRNINKEYEDWVFKWAQQVFPLMKEGAPLFIFGARRTISRAIVAFEKAGFLLKDILAWEKSNAHHRSQDIFKVLIKRGRKYCITENTLEQLRLHPELRDFIGKLKDFLNVPFGNWKDFIDNLKNIDKKIVEKFTYELLEYSLDDEEVQNQVTKWRGWKLGNLAPYYEPIAWFMKPYDSVVTLTDNVLENEVGAMNMNLCKIDGREPKNILRFDFSKEELENKIHEAQKPVELIKYLINLTTLENQVVIDPFVGSGTTAVACKELNRRFIAFEINEKYYNQAMQRLNLIKNITDKEQSTNEKISVKVNNPRQEQIAFDIL